MNVKTTYNIHFKRVGIPSIFVIIIFCFFPSFVYASNSNSLNGSPYEKGIQEEREGNYSSALSFYQLALEHSQRANKPIQQSNILLGLVRIYQKLNRYTEVEKTIAVLETLTASLDDHHTLIKNYRAISIAYQSIRRFRLARDYFTVAVELARTNSDAPTLAMLLNEQGFADTLIQDFSSGIISFGESKEIYQRLKKHDKAFDALLNEIQAAILLGDKENSVKLLRELEKKIRLTIKSLTSAQALRICLQYRAAHINFNLDGSYRKRAYTFLSKVEKKSLKEKDYVSYSYAKGYIGQMYADSGRYQESIAETNVALSKALEYDLILLIHRWRLQLARAYAASGDVEKSLQYYQEVVDLYDMHGVNSFLSQGKLYENEIESGLIEYRNLLLKNGTKKSSKTNQEEEFKKALMINEQLIRYNLKNHCQFSCEIKKTQKLSAVADDVMVLLPFYVDDELLLLSLNGNNISYKEHKISSYDFQHLLGNLLLSLVSQKKYDKKYALKVSTYLLGNDALDIKQIKKITLLHNKRIGEIPIHILQNSSGFIANQYALETILSLSVFDSADGSDGADRGVRFPGSEKITRILSDNTANLYKNQKIIDVNTIYSQLTGNVDIHVPFIIHEDYRDSFLAFPHLSVKWSPHFTQGSVVNLDVLITRQAKYAKLQHLIDDTSMAKIRRLLVSHEEGGASSFVDQFINNLMTGKKGMDISQVYKNTVNSAGNVNLDDLPPWSNYRLIQQTPH